MPSPIRTCSWPRPPNSMRRSKRRSSLVTRSGTCWRPGAAGFGVGLPSGGYGQEELERAGAARVYEDPADLLKHLDEAGGRR